MPTMTVTRNEGRWHKSNIVFRHGKIVLYDKYATNSAALGMDYIDYLSVLTRQMVVVEIASGEVIDLAAVF